MFNLSLNSVAYFQRRGGGNPVPQWQSGIFVAGNNAFGWGFAKPPIVSTPLGSLIEEPYTGAELISFWEVPDDSRVIVTFSGDLVAQLTNQTFIINGTTLSVLEGPTYDPVNNWTIMYLEPHWMIEGEAYVITRVSDVAPSGVPVNEQLPAITGLPQQGSELTFDVGMWSGEVDTLEIRIRQINPPATLLDWTVVEGTDTGIVDPAVDSSLVLDVRASNSGGSTTASSAPFGPIVAGGDQFIVGIVINGSLAHNPTPAGSPVTYSLAGSSPGENLYTPEKGWGFVGTLATTGSGAYSTTNRADPRLGGRVSANVTPGQLGLRIDVPEPGTYLIYAAFGQNSAGTPNAALYDGPAGSSPLLHTFNPSATEATSLNVLDGASLIKTFAEWTAASEYGGDPVEVEVTGTSIVLARTTTNGAPIYNCITVVKKGV